MKKVKYKDVPKDYRKNYGKIALNILAAIGICAATVILAMIALYIHNFY